MIRTRSGWQARARGEGAVPAGGLAIRARAALGINPSALRPGCELLAGLGSAGAGNTRLTKAATSQEALPNFPFFPFVIAGQSRPKNDIASLVYARQSMPK